MNSEESDQKHLKSEVVRVERQIEQLVDRNGGRYDIDAHLRHDPSATQAFAETHVRRLEAMRRLTGGVTREADGTWVIAPDHLTRAAAYEAARAQDRPVRVETLSAQPLDKLVGAEAATWLDHELIANKPMSLRDAGLGQDVRDAQTRRRQWLIAQGLAEEVDGRTVYRAGLVQALQRRELVRVGAHLSRELGMPFVESEPGARVDGIYRRPIETVSGRFALVEKSREFTLVPWRPVLDRHVDKNVSGIMRADGISWSFGRGRGAPSIT